MEIPELSHLSVLRRAAPNRGFQELRCTLCSVSAHPRQLPAGLGDNHLRAQFVEFVPELLRFQAAGDFSHLFAGDDGGGGYQRLCAQRG